MVMREGQYEYLHEFKERINEIISLQKKHHGIIEKNEHNTLIQQTSLAKLHRLNITLSNYFVVAPSKVNGIPYQRHQKANQPKPIISMTINAAVFAVRHE
jgi:hypothetical protein